MKKNSFYIRFGSLLTAGALIFSSCDNGFEDLNTNPDTSPTPTPGYLLTKAQLDGVSDFTGGNNFLMGTVQYTTSFNNVAGFGSKYNNSQINQTWSLFTTAYPREVNNVLEVIRATEDKPEYVNIYSAARIMRVFIFHRITDVYGAVPYFDAGKGATETLFKPAYDDQESIYMDMLNELDQAVAAFNGSVVVPIPPDLGASDAIYAGNLAQWKKFGNSLMLRLAMRLTKIKPDVAKQWAQKAIAAGVILLDADIAKITYPGSGLDTDKNPLALNLWNSDYIKSDGKTNTEGGKFHQAFISALKTKNDPRLPVLAVVWAGSPAKPDTTQSLQIGMPPTADGEANLPQPFITYSEPNPKTVLKLSAPYVVVGNAEMQFLLAEAAIRGWYAGDTPEKLYADGIRAAMRQLALYGADGIIASNKIEKYVTDNALAAGTDEQKYEQIYTQFWLGVFPNAMEVYNTWRRTGHPNFVPNNFVGNGTNGQIFRRFQYPNSEQNLNADNYNAAVNLLKANGGGDDILTRVWWDKQ
jgi:hypothetical protein